MATTTNYGWTTPDDTALVKDGASAIRTLGSSVDTTTKNLNPETTLGDLSFRSSTSNVNTRIPIGSSGQHLTVVAGVPAWSTASDQTPLTTKGDLFTFSTVDARLGVGANGTTLVADSAEATGLKWAAAAGGLTFINKYEPSSVSEQNINNIFSSTYKYYKIVWSVVMSDAAEFQFRLRVSGSDATSNYNISQVRTTGASSAGGSQETGIGAIPASFGATSGIKQGEMIVFNPFTATKTGIDYHHYSENASSGVCGALHTDATSYTGCTFYPATGTITGEISVYGFNRS